MILVPSAEATVGKLRRKLDRSAAWAVPLHITVLYPFAAPNSMSEQLLARLGDVLRRCEPFEFALAKVGWFEQRVMYLAPTPREPFAELTNAIAADFPEHPPYGGAYSEAVPHLTVGEGVRPARMRRAARRLERQLPIRATATEVCLMAPDSSGRWDIERRFPLGRTVSPEPTIS
ncbi:MAG TPA: 2'-5' RNA ligase family protein [Acidimicrobiales bacterium]